MRNVQQLTDVQVRIKEPTAEASVFCVSHSSGFLYRLSSTGHLTCLHPGTSEQLWDSQLPVCQATHSWQFIDYSDQLSGVLCGSSCGQLIVVTIEDQALEEIGEFEGVSTGILSPQFKFRTRVLLRAFWTFNGQQMVKCLQFSVEQVHCW